MVPRNSKCHQIYIGDRCKAVTENKMYGNARLTGSAICLVTHQAVSAQMDLDPTFFQHEKSCTAYERSRGSWCPHISPLPRKLGCGHKTGCNIKSSAWEKPTSTKYEIVRTTVSYQPARETVLRSCDMPSRTTCNPITPGTYPWYYRCTQHK